MLFTDLVGSTALEMSVGPGVAEPLRREHFALLRGPLSVCGGREVKSTGDGLMVVFANASQAARCAVAMQQAIERRNKTADHLFSVRMGIGVGEVIPAEGDYYGRPPIEAARLCAAAQGGQILATEVVRLLSARRDGLAFQSKGELDLKGLPEPVPTCEVMWEPAGEPEAAAAAPLPAVLRGMPSFGFVGRVDERGELAAMWQRTLDQRRGLALVSGEPGIGKTRLATHLASEAHAQGATILLGRCEEEVGAPFHPWAEALAHLVDHARAPLLRAHIERHGGELLRLVPQLRARIPEVPDPRDSDPDTERYLLLGAVTGLLAAASGEHPLLLILDDIHWADRPSLALLRHVVRTVPECPLLIIGTYRDSELTAQHPLSSTLADLRRENSVERIALTGFSRDDVVDFMTNATGHELGDDGLHLAGEVGRETGGNPFFISEILRNLPETGAIVQQDGRWMMASSSLVLPQSVREVVSQRVERLGDEVGRTLEAAAVLGREFDLDLLARVVDADEGEVLDRLDAALTALLVAETARPGRFSFHHAIINHTLYEQLGRTRRARLHRRIAETLEELCGDEPGALVGDLARHWAAATVPSDSDRAARYAVRAGERALAELAPDEALQWFTQARELAPADPGVCCDAQIGLGEAQRRTGDASYRETLLNAARFALEHGDDRRLAAAVLANNRGSTSAFGLVDQERVELIERALERIGRDDRATRGRLLSLLALELTFDTDWQRRRRLADEGLELVRASGDTRALASVLRDRTYSVWDPRDPAGRQATYEELLALAEQLDDPTLRCWALWGKMGTDAALGNYDSALEVAHALSTLADELGHPVLRWSATYHLACLASASDVERLQRLSEQAFALGSESGEADAAMVYGGQQGVVWWSRGELEPLLGMIDQMSASFPAMPAFRAAGAMVRAQAGMTDEARAELDAAHARDYDSTHVDALMTQTLAFWSEVAVRLGDQRSAARLHDLLAPVGERTVFSGGQMHGAIDGYRGGLAWTLGHRDEAETLWRSALEQNERAAPIPSARLLALWGELLARAGETEQAGERLRESRALAAAHGCTGLVALVDQALGAVS